MVLRQITDELMFEIRELTGQEYRNVYAGKTAETGADGGGQGGHGHDATPARWPSAPPPATDQRKRLSGSLLPEARSSMHVAEGTVINCPPRCRRVAP
jgi:hypothetical protein